MDFSSVITTKGFSRADYTIVKNNPNATIYELTEKGLSKKAAEQLQELVDNVKKSPTIAEPISVTSASIQPIIGRTVTGGKDRVMLFNRRTGLTIPMHRKGAENLVRRDSQNYQITGRG